jgi:NAD(P)-binding Rossmann-like domain
MRSLYLVLSVLLSSSTDAFTTTSVSFPTKATISRRNLPVSAKHTQTRQGQLATIISLQSTPAEAATSELEYEKLSLPSRSGRPLKVAIAGGGVGGLTTALCLLKKGIDVTVYEKTAAFARFGGPIQFASNALSVLKEIDDTLFTRVMDKFTFTGTRTCGIKDGLRADGSFRMTNDSIDYLWNPDAPADWFVKFPLKVRDPFLNWKFYSYHN